MTDIIVKRFILLVFLGACLLWLLHDKLFPFTFDSLIYISTAENIHRGQGLLSTNFYVEKSVNDFIPLKLEPPGYPILVSFLMLFGINGFVAGLLVPRICFLALPFLFYLIFKKFMPSSQAMVGAFVSIFMFAVIQCTLTAWSDVPCLCFSLMALLITFRIIEKGEESPTFLIFLAGAFLGYVYLIRLVGITLICSIGGGLIACLVLKLISKKDFFKTVFIYMTGIALVIAPYLYRNWCVFGRIQSYKVPPSQVSWTKNVMDYLESIANMLWGTPSMMWIVAIFIIAVGIFILINSRKLIQDSSKKFVFMVILSMYFLMNSTALIVFRTLWLSVEKIDGRYLIQIVWILMMALVLAIDHGIDFFKKRWDLKKARITGVLLFAFIVTQAILARDFFESQQSELTLSKTIEYYVPFLQKIPKDFVIVTNWPDLVYYHAQRNARALNIYTPGHLREVFATKRKFVVVLFKDGWNFPGHWGWYNLEWVRPEGYHKIFSDDHMDVFGLLQM